MIFVVFRHPDGYFYPVLETEHSKHGMDCFIAEELHISVHEYREILLSFGGRKCREIAISKDDIVFKDKESVLSVVEYLNTRFTVMFKLAK